MWRPWGKSTIRVHSTSPSSSPFSCSSFKDIQTLCLDEPPQQPSPSPSPPRKPSVFHRVRLANSLLRTWSTHLPPQSLPQPQPQSQPPKLARTLSHPVPEPVPDAPPTAQTDPARFQPQQPPKLARTLSHPVPETVPDAPPTVKPDPDQLQQQKQPPKLPRSFSEPEPEPEPDAPPSDATPIFPGAEQRVVVYYTSLRVVRPTFEACKSVLSILSGFRVRVDERDVSIDSGFMVELNRVMGQTGLTLPRVFIGGRYVGGAEEVKQLNEVGELKKMLEDLPAVDPSECHVCGGYRFVLCNECDGSRKLYTEKVGFKTCNACNENGLVRCPSCFSAPLLS